MARPTKVTLNNLNLREKKAWRVIDQYLADRKDKKIPANTKLEAAQFILKRLYPEKHHVEVGNNLLEALKQVYGTRS